MTDDIVFPKLPKELKPSFVWYVNEGDGTKIVAMAVTTDSVHFFYWDGVSVSWNLGKSFLRA